MRASGDCLGCGCHVVFSARCRCGACYQAARKQLQLKRCGRCGRRGHIWPELGHCGHCSFVDWRRSGPDRNRECGGCGTISRIIGWELCSACFQKDPAWPFRYASRLSGRLVVVPDWFEAYVDYLAERYSPSRAVDHLRWIGNAITSSCSARPDVVASALPARSKPFDEFVVHAKLGFAHDPEPARAHARRSKRLDEIPAGYADAANAFCEAMVRRQHRADRLNVRADANRTIEARLRTIRDFAIYTREGSPHVDSVELVTIAEVEAFLATCHQSDAATQLAYLRLFFSWCRRQKLVLTDATVGLRRNSKSGFSGPMIALDTQRQLYDRWTNPTNGMNPYEPAVGLLAMLHAFSRRDIVDLKLASVKHELVEVTSRTKPVPLDPATWDAVCRAAAHSRTLGATNPHLIVNKSNKTNQRPVSGGYLSTLMANGPAASLRALRSTRLSALVGDLDPITVSAAIGIGAAGAIYFLNDPEPAVEEGANGLRIR